MRIAASASNGMFSIALHLLLPSLLAGVVALILLRWLAPARWEGLRRWLGEPATLWAAAVFAFLVYAACGALMLAFPAPTDPVELQVISVSAMSTHGAPLYHPAGAASRYALAYGPFCYLPYIGVLALWPGSLAAIKCVVAAANVLLIFLIWGTYRSALGLPAAAAATAFTLLAHLNKTNYLFQLRGDVFLFVSVGAAMFAATAIRRRSAAILVFALAMAVGSGVKVTAVLYLVVPWLLLRRRVGTGAALMAAAAGGLLSLLPFATHIASLPAFLYWLHAASLQPRSSKELLGNLFVSAFLFLPPLAALFSLSWARARDAVRAQGAPLLTFVASVLVLDVLVSKFGAGRHHLIPFVLVSGSLAMLIVQSGRGGVVKRFMQERAAARRTPLAASSWAPLLAEACVLAVLLFVTISSLSEVSDLWITFRTDRRAAAATEADAAQAAKEYGQRGIQAGLGSRPESFGPGESYPPSFAEATLALEGQPVTLDPSALADMELSRLPVPQATVAALRACQPAAWLIPEGERPFSAESIYSVMYPSRFRQHFLYAPALREAFDASYRKAAQTRFFDVYICAHHPAG